MQPSPLPSASLFPANAEALALTTNRPLPPLVLLLCLRRAYPRASCKWDHTGRVLVTGFSRLCPPGSSLLSPVLLLKAERCSLWMAPMLCPLRGCWLPGCASPCCCDAAVNTAHPHLFLALLPVLLGLCSEVELLDQMVNSIGNLGGTITMSPTVTVPSYMSTAGPGSRSAQPH